jgi:predicted membrane metal-binding protein
MPGFFLFNFFKDAYDEYKHTGVFSLETLIGNPMLFFLSLACFLILMGLAVYFLMAAL